MQTISRIRPFLCIALGWLACSTALLAQTVTIAEATRTVVKESFVVLPYTTDDLVNARRLIDAGSSAVLAMKLGIQAGRHAYLAGRMPKKQYASASSPMTGVVGS